MDFVSGLIDGFIATSLWEWLAVFFGVLYLIAAWKQKIICWAFAFISSVIYAYLCFTANYYLEFGLQIYYVAMAVVGFVFWNRKGQGNQESEMKIQRWNLKKHSINILVSGLLTLGLGYFFSMYTHQEKPYLDAFTTCFSLTATFMVTRKVLGNWVYWIIIDLFSIYLYGVKGFYLTSVLFAFYTVLAIIGYFTWLKQFKNIPSA